MFINKLYINVMSRCPCRTDVRGVTCRFRPEIGCRTDVRVALMSGNLNITDSVLDMLLSFTIEWAQGWSLEPSLSLIRIEFRNQLSKGSKRLLCSTGITFKMQLQIQFVIRTQKKRIFARHFWLLSELCSPDLTAARNIWDKGRRRRR